MDRRAKWNLFVQTRSISRFYGTTSAESPRKAIIHETRSLLRTFCRFLSLLTAHEFRIAMERKLRAQKDAKKRSYIFTTLRVFSHISESRNSSHDWLSVFQTPSMDQTAKFFYPNTLRTSYAQCGGNYEHTSTHMYTEWKMLKYIKI